MKRALWVTPIAPCFDGGGGGEIRQAHLLAALSDRFDVRLVTAGRLRDDRVRAMVRSVHEVAVTAHVDPANQFRRRLRDIRWELVERQPDEVARNKSVRRAMARAVAGDAPCDIVCVEYMALAPLLPRRREVPWTLTLHNLGSEMARHNAALAPGPRQRAMLAVEQRNARRLERWAVGAYDVIVTPSQADAAALPGAVAVVPNGVDVDRFRPSSLPAAPRLVFTGALHTFPNRDAVRWFCSEVWPRVRAEVPAAALDIVGSRPPADIQSLASRDGVALHADVPDVVPFLESARVAIVPIRVGSGSRLKILEAFAAERPVVSTTIGAGGLTATPGREFLVADDPASFAREVIRCLSDDELARGLARRGRELVEDGYSWARIGQRYVALLEETATSRLGSA